MPSVDHYSFHHHRLHSFVWWSAWGTKPTYAIKMLYFSFWQLFFPVMSRLSRKSSKYAGWISLFRSSNSVSLFSLLLTSFFLCTHYTQCSTILLWQRIKPTSTTVLSPSDTLCLAFIRVRISCICVCVWFLAMYVTQCHIFMVAFMVSMSWTYLCVCVFG